MTRHLELATRAHHVKARLAPVAPVLRCRSAVRRLQKAGTAARLERRRIIGLPPPAFVPVIAAMTPTASTAPSRRFARTLPKRAALAACLCVLTAFAPEAPAAPASGDWRSIEGVWEGERIGTWTFQVLREFGRGLALVDSGDGGRGMLEALPQKDAWLFFQGDEDDEPGDVQLWRLEIVKGMLLTRSYEPHSAENWFRVGRFEKYTCARVAPLGEREEYDPADDAGGDEPVDWEKLHRERTGVRADELAVLRRGGLDPDKETARRREWAAAEASDEVDDVVERMSLEQNRPAEEIDRQAAEARAVARMMNQQFYEYGARPPGFENCDPYFETTSDMAVRQRRQPILLWNLKLRLERAVKQEQDYQRRLHGMLPEQREQAVVALRESIASQEQRLAEARAAMAQHEAGTWEHENARSSIAGLEEDIADSQHRLGSIGAGIIRRASLEAPGGYEEVPFAQILAETREKVVAELDLPRRLHAIAEQLDKELPGTAGPMPPPGAEALETVPADCQLELPSRM